MRPRSLLGLKGAVERRSERRDGTRRHSRGRQCRASELEGAQLQRTSTSCVPLVSHQLVTSPAAFQTFFLALPRRISSSFGLFFRFPFYSSTSKKKKEQPFNLLFLKGELQKRSSPSFTFGVNLAFRREECPRPSLPLLLLFPFVLQLRVSPAPVAAAHLPRCCRSSRLYGTYQA